MKSYVLINPGTGELADTSADHAANNMQALLEDAGLGDLFFEHKPEGDHGGRYAFAVTYNGRAAAVDMPGWELKRVRFTGAADQDQWAFPRLYVDGASWVWQYAVSILRAHLAVRTNE